MGHDEYRTGKRALCDRGRVHSVAACTPRVEVAADKPITINLNVKIDHEIRVKLDKELDQVLSQQSGLF